MPNVIPAALKRDVILNNALRAFKRRVLPVMAFATAMRNVPLQGTNKILVPYYPLATAASTDFNGTYTVGNDSEVQTKEVTVNKRKYQSLSFTGEEWNRQPYLDIERIVMMKVEKLAADVLDDIFSVITATNYPSATIAPVAASAFDLDEVLSLRRICNESDWSEVGRSIVLDSGHVENLLKDSRLGNQNAGSTAPVRDGRFGGRIAGFEPFEVPNMPENAENLVGFVALPSSMAVAFSPVEPPPAVRRHLAEYSTFTDPDSGLTLEYRVWGDPDTDKQKEVIECNYGYNVLEAAALKPITKV
jgi:hypothetical protein